MGSSFIHLIRIHTEDTTSERDTCTPVFIAALFIIARTWTQPRCPSADEWIRKLWYIYTMEYYSAIKNNSFELVLVRWSYILKYAQPLIESSQFLCIHLNKIIATIYLTVIIVSSNGVLTINPDKYIVKNHFRSV